MITDAEAAQILASRRWPVGVRCVQCGSGRVTENSRPERRWPQWRCRDCRKEFTAVTGTKHHRTKRSPHDVLTSVDRGPSVAESATTTGLSPGAIRILWAMRRRPDGAVIGKLSEIAGLSRKQSLRCLRRLKDLGICEQDLRVVYCGHDLTERLVWRLTYSRKCLEVLGKMPPMRGENGERATDGAGVPHRFWHLFWSGLRGEDIDLSVHARHVAETCIGGRDNGAEAWTLRNMSDGVLLGVWESGGHGADSMRLLEEELRTRAVLL